MMCLTSTFLFLLCYVNNFKCITLGCFLLLCVWHAAYVNWWDIKWVCLCSYKYMDCEWKQPNNQALFWLNRQTVAWKILQKFMMTWSWQWHENHSWISYCFLEHRCQEWVSIATYFSCWLIKSRKHKSSDRGKVVFVRCKWTWLDWISSLSSLYVKCERVRQLKMVVLGTLCPTPRNLSEQHYLLLCFGH